MSNIKGHLFTMAINYIKNNYGEGAFKEVLNKLTFEDKTILSKKIIPLSWLPCSVYNRFIEKIDLVLGKGDYYLCRDIGYYEAKEGINTFYKFFIKIGDPLFVIKRATQFWGSLHDDGKLEVEITGEKSAKARLFNFSDAGKAHCRSLEGYFIGVLEMSGAKDVHIFETKCISKGDQYCEFIGNWE